MNVFGLVAIILVLSKVFGGISLEWGFIVAFMTVGLGQSLFSIMCRD